MLEDVLPLMEVVRSKEKWLLVRTVPEEVLQLRGGSALEEELLLLV